MTSHDLARGIGGAEAGRVLGDNGPMTNHFERLGFRRYKPLRPYEREL